jgi:hypothetical protein
VALTRLPQAANPTPGRRRVDLRLTGCSFIVTGGSRGVGREIVILLLGSNICLRSTTITEAADWPGADGGA